MQTKCGHRTRAIRSALRAFALLVMLIGLCGLSRLMAQSNTRQIVVPPPSAPAPSTTRSLTGPASSSAAQPATWAAIPGSATAIGANARGDVWIIANTPPGRDHNIYRLRGRTWQQVPGTGMRIAVDPAGNAWVVESSGAILRYTGTAWERIPGNATDIGVGAKGAVWIIGGDQSISRGVVISTPASKPANPTRGRFGAAATQAPTPTQQYRWEKVSGTAVRIAVDTEGDPWVVNSAGQIHHYKGNTWTQFPGTARDIAVGADGVVYLVGTAPSHGGFTILRSQGATWVSDGIAGESITAGAAGVVYVAQDATAANALAERVPNRLTAGSPPSLPPAPASTVAQQTPPVASPATQQPQQPVSVNMGGAAPSGPLSPDQPIAAHTGVRPMTPGMAAPTQAPSGTTGTQTASTPTQTPTQPPSSTGQHASTPTQSAPQTGSGQVPIPVQSATIQIPPTSNSTSITVPSQAVPINPPTITSTPAQSVPNSGAVVVAPPTITQPTLNQPSSSMVVAPPGTVTIPTGTITLNPVVTSGSLVVNPGGSPSIPGPSGGPTSGSVTTGSLVIPGSSASTPATISNTPLQVTGLGYVPITAPAGSIKLISSDPYVYTPGKLLCSDPEAMGTCGNVDAGFVGGYTLNTSCSSGFYDMTNGGTCWKCPDDDGNGPWLRSADPVTAGTACWRVPKESLTRAVWDKQGFAWDCHDPQFWDGKPANLNGGNCWHCPSDHPRRTANPVDSGQACATAIQNQTAAAIFLKFNGCSAPDKSTMYPKDLRRPGQPFLDIASGLSVANNAGGACWTCPVTDEQGNYLYTERNVNTLIGRKTGNNGCTVGFRYTPGRFVEPGLSGLPGVAEVLTQEQVFQRPAALTTFLYGLAHVRNFTGAQADSWVAAQWNDIATHPYQNAQIKALMHQYLISSAPAYMYASGMPGTGTADAIAAHTKLVNSFQEYMRARQTYIAQEALDMYYAWKKNVGETRSKHAESELQTLFYYGTVPLDFSSIVSAALTPTVTATAVLTSVIAAQQYGATTDPFAYISPQSDFRVVPRQFHVSNLLSRMFKPTGGGGGGGAAGEPQGYIDDAYVFKPTPAGAGAGSEAGSELGGELGGELAGESAAEGAAEGAAILAAQIDLVSGPAGIALAGVTMAAMAIQQVVEIAQAEPNLIQAKNNAMKPVNLSNLLQQTNGPDQVATFWSYATGVSNEPGNSQITTMAKNAYAAAKQSNFGQLQANPARSNPAQAKQAPPSPPPAKPGPPSPGQNPLRRN